VKDIVKQLELVARISIDDQLKMPVRKDDHTYWILFSRMHKDMISNPWRIVDRSTQRVTTFPKPYDVVTFLERRGFSKKEIQDEVEYVIHSNINFVMGNLVEIKELYSDEEIQDIHEVEVARFDAMKTRIMDYFDTIKEQSEPKAQNHLTVVTKEEDHD